MTQPEIDKLLDASLASVKGASSTLQILRDLHVQALTEKPYLSTDAQPASVALERFVALEPDKCALVYLLLRSSNAKYVIEAGTSFGLSTIYLALAVSQNVIASHSTNESGSDGTAKVIATENEAVKAARARQHWKTVSTAGKGDDIEKWIELREGDILQTLSIDLPPRIDFVLFDIWSYLALPTLKLIHPNLKIGAMIVVDNLIAAREGYKDFLGFLSDPVNGFRMTTLPYTGGLMIAVYLGN